MLVGPLWSINTFGCNYSLLGYLSISLYFYSMFLVNFLYVYQTAWRMLVTEILKYYQRFNQAEVWFIQVFGIESKTWCCFCSMLRVIVLNLYLNLKCLAHCTNMSSKIWFQPSCPQP